MADLTHKVLVLDYLQATHPRVGRSFLMELLKHSDLQGDENFWELPEWRQKVLQKSTAKDLAQLLIAPGAPTTPTRQSKRARSASSSEDEAPTRSAVSAKKVSPKVAAKKPVVDSSDSDEAPARPSAKKVSPKAVAKKPVIDSSDSDEAPARPSAKKVSPKAVAKKPVVDSSDSDEAPARPSAAARPSAKKADSSDSDDDVPVRNSTASNGNGAPSFTPKTGRVSVPEVKPRTSRINLDAVRFENERLKDNTPGEEATSFLQNRKMMAVRGKEFNKHKQKNKAKLYAAGVDTSVRSFKFGGDDSD